MALLVLSLACLAGMPEQAIMPYASPGSGFTMPQMLIRPSVCGLLLRLELSSDPPARDPSCPFVLILDES